MVTFVSCVFGTDGVWETYLQWTKLSIRIQLYVQDEEMLHLLRTFPVPHVLLAPMVDIRNETWAKIGSPPLPLQRNLEKDTEPHLWNMLHKIPCLDQCVKENPFQTDFFAYIDFDVFSLFRDPRTVDYLQEHFGVNELFAPKALFIPGMWPITVVPKNEICWRFVGAFVFGSAAKIQSFAGLYRDHFQSYFSDVLTWEVNYWAWLEPVIDCSWYKGDHNDTLVRVPGVFGYYILQGEKTVYPYPGLSPYRPMSASYVEHNGQRILNTRFVNYWILPNGAYWYPEDEHKIRTKNVCSFLDESFCPLSFTEVAPLEKKKVNVFSEGIEDIRLYRSVHGDVRFIGSTLEFSYTDKIRMIVGKYSIQGTVTLEDARPVVPPYDTWCEKNWSPIPLGTEDGFIYKWNPLEIGRLIEHKLGWELEIVHRIPTNTEIFGNIKGSTPFYAYENGFIGLVHFSEETTPRQYYHRLVVLNSKYAVVKVSASFCFVSVGTEFCIGMERNDTKYVFWISQQDRDPAMIEVDAAYWDDKWILLAS